MPGTTKARIGAITAGTRTLPTRPSAKIASRPAEATAGPTRPAKTTVGVTTAASTTSLATVAATEIEMKAPTKLSSEAKAIATWGLAAPVEIDVATTFAVSWKPLVKSKASAVPTTMTRMRSELTSRVLDDYALDDLGGGLRRIDRLLEHGEHVLPADHDHRVDAVGEQRGDRVARDPVALVLEPVDLDPVFVQVLEVGKV